MRRLDMVVHSDWSKSQNKRWATVAERQGQNWFVTPPEPVGPVATFIDRMVQRVHPEESSVLFGFDFPIGIPEAYAKAAGISSFVHVLPQLGAGAWIDFYTQAELPTQINVRRPFYPRRPGGTRRAHLVQGLGVQDSRSLLRRCEAATPHRSAACSLFWTLGGNQVGPAAMSGWKHLIAPAIHHYGTDVGVWPFDGNLVTLLQDRSIVLAETYPKDVFARVGFPRGGWSKRSQSDRVNRGVEVTAWLAGRLPAVTLTPALVHTIAVGFGVSKDGEDPFDSLIGLLGMLEVVVAGRSEGAPIDVAVRQVEGWILGQS